MRLRTHVIVSIVKMATFTKVRNPTTGRAIQVGGDVYNKLIAQGYRMVGGELVAPQAVALPPPILPPKVSTPIPNLGSLDTAVQQILREEDTRRQRACDICQQYYINRYMPFTPPELNNLRAITGYCAECGRLCDRQYYRRGIVNPPQCTPYKTAAVQAQNQVQRIEHEQVMQAIRTDLAAGKDVSKYFPTVPK